MAYRTLREKFMLAYIARGYIIVANPQSRKYVQLKHPDRPSEFIYLGKAGALRRGRTVADSRAISDAGRQRLLLEV